MLMQQSNLERAPSGDTAGSRCRLCNGALQFTFSQLVLKKYSVAYFECLSCKSLQTEQPYWLEEAYKTNLNEIDVGAAQRNLTNFCATYVVAKIFGLRNIIDYGGGDGFLCRLLRDYCLNCFVSDKYARTTYAAGFTRSDFSRPDLLLAFEVAEHFTDPCAEFEKLFALDPKVLMVTTDIYWGLDRDWWYFIPDAGQHIFFYSLEALQWIASAHSRKLLLYRNYLLFVKPEYLGRINKAFLRLLSSRIALRGIRILLMVKRAKGQARDFNRMSQPERKHVRGPE
jgi:hypothetical protein